MVIKGQYEPWGWAGYFHIADIWTVFLNYECIARIINLQKNLDVPLRSKPDPQHFTLYKHTQLQIRGGKKESKEKQVAWNIIPVRLGSNHQSDVVNSTNSH